MSTRKRVKRALSRDEGLNTILLDIKQELGIVSADIRNIKEDEVSALEVRRSIQAELKVLNGSMVELNATVRRLEPVVDTLNTEYQRQVGFHTGLTKVFKRAHALYLFIGGVIGTTAGYLVGWPKK